MDKFKIELSHLDIHDLQVAHDIMQKYCSEHEYFPDPCSFDRNLQRLGTLVERIKKEVEAQHL